ncbi:MAG: hypothetical protein KDJ86_10995 [Bauldia sp.]|uniref:hypothetical protein n=1 Tax=Bauldia sp. TaxID=2575872 RepID=UPI001DD72278|nr:hypothetical protein [Bauldia sp.]MCB1496305.1 hypothetical protein [Bauldia sp.]
MPRMIACLLILLSGATLGSMPMPAVAQECEAGTTMGGPSDNRRCVSTVFRYLEPIRTKLPSRDSEYRLDIIEEDISPAGGRVIIQTKHIPADCIQRTEYAWQYDRPLDRITVGDAFVITYSRELLVDECKNPGTHFSVMEATGWNHTNIVFPGEFYAAMGGPDQMEPSGKCQNLGFGLSGDNPGRIFSHDGPPGASKTYVAGESGDFRSGRPEECGVAIMQIMISANKGGQYYIHQTWRQQPAGSDGGGYGGGDPDPGDQAENEPSVCGDKPSEEAFLGRWEFAEPNEAIEFGVGKAVFGADGSGRFEELSFDGCTVDVIWIAQGGVKCAWNLNGSTSWGRAQFTVGSDGKMTGLWGHCEQEPTKDWSSDGGSGTLTVAGGDPEEPTPAAPVPPGQEVVTPGLLNGGEGRTCTDQWIAEATRRLNIHDGGPRYNARKPWSVNQYGIVVGKGIESAYEPDDWAEKGGTRETWMWATYSNEAEYPFGGMVGNARVPGYRWFMRQCLGTGDASDDPSVVLVSPPPGPEEPAPPGEGPPAAGPGAGSDGTPQFGEIACADCGSASITLGQFSFCALSHVSSGGANSSCTVTLRDGIWELVASDPANDQFGGRAQTCAAVCTNF